MVFCCRFLCFCVVLLFFDWIHWFCSKFNIVSCVLDLIHVFDRFDDGIHVFGKMAALLSVLSNIALVRDVRKCSGLFGIVRDCSGFAPGGHMPMFWRCQSSFDDRFRLVFVCVGLIIPISITVGRSVRSVRGCSGLFGIGWWRAWDGGVSSITLGVPWHPRMRAQSGTTSKAMTFMHKHWFWNELWGFCMETLIFLWSCENHGALYQSYAFQHKVSNLVDLRSILIFWATCHVSKRSGVYSICL